MIEKIIDKYFANKYQKFVKSIIIKYLLDFKFESKNSITRLYIKKPKYKDYENVYSFTHEKAFEYIIDWKKNMELIEYLIKKYYEKEKNE